MTEETRGGIRRAEDSPCDGGGGWKGAGERERWGRGQGSEREGSTHAAGLNPGQYWHQLARSSQTWVTIPPTQASRRPRGCLMEPRTGGGTAVSRKQSHRERREGQGDPAWILHVQSFWGPDLLSAARPGLSANLREEEKLSRGQPTCDPGSERPGELGEGPGELGEGPGRCGRGLGSWGPEIQAGL